MLYAYTQFQQCRWGTFRDICFLSSSGLFITNPIFLTLHFVLQFLLYLLWRRCHYQNASRIQPDMFSELFCTRERNITCRTFYCILLTGKSNKNFLYRCQMYNLPKGSMCGLWRCRRWVSGLLIFHWFCHLISVNKTEYSHTASAAGFRNFVRGMFTGHFTWIQRHQ